MKQLMGIFAFFLVLGFVVEHWRILLALVVLGIVATVAVLSAPRVFEVSSAAWTRSRQRRRERAERARAARLRLAARADEQHTLYLDGDTRGIYGDYPPESIE
ncbi:MAG: hypothetical protein GXY65_09345 [Rhodococcus sp.]|uniref:hypothetical protein n=1 Tax=Rhodococcus TaxID=1827 RepID=UPI0016A9A385|nr:MULTISPECIES: hypothetical protein [Rhodococcus]NLV79528.1 hypothetical protein [Rhodococcus sp. (in: high G+C Gram-positive bacteria)]